MNSGTIGGMKVLAVKGVEPYGNLWAVRYTRQISKSVQDAVFWYGTPEEAREKRDELLDILQHHNGLYVGSKEKKKLKVSCRRAAR
jgi:hypothetical protein